MYDERDDPEVETPRLAGAGGGSRKGGSSASTTPDNLFSTAVVKLVDLLGEGEVGGVVGGLRGVYLNDVPVQNTDGSLNFKGLTAEFRNGTPDQDYMAGYPDVQSTQNVGIKALQNVPVTATVSDPSVDRVRVTLFVPSLFLASSDGKVQPNTVSYAIYGRYSGGPLVNLSGDQLITGKTTSGYYRSHEFPLPRNPAGSSPPWHVQLYRLSPDTDDFNNSQDKYTNQSDIIFSSITSIVDAKLSYPHTALVGLTAQASSFGSSMPARSYLVDGVQLLVPSNYDPVARTYAGMWDGTFKRAVSDNPAWALYCVLQDERFGLGDYVDVASIDKWSLYEVARYCDVLVPDGRGGQEPRYTFNATISNQQDAFELLQLVAQVFRGLVYWSAGSVTASQDRPRDVSMLVTESNVIDGEFSYSSSSQSARHTVALVGWNDPSNLYKPQIEAVEDNAGIARYGYNATKVDLLGCTSRGQAQRAGRWLLFTELQQTQVVNYRAGLDHAVRRPGDVVAVQDPSIVSVDDSGNLSGRIETASLSALRLDHDVDLGPGQYSVSVTLVDGTVQEKRVVNQPGTTIVLHLESDLRSVPDPGAVWLLSGPVKPRLFSIVSIHEEEPHIFAVTGLQYEPGKYATIDEGAAFVPTEFSEFPKKVSPPTNLRVRESSYTELGILKQTITLSWTIGESLNVASYYVTAITPTGAVLQLPRRNTTSADFTDATSGTWKFFVVAEGLDGTMSQPSEILEYEVRGWSGEDMPKVANLRVRGGGSVFTGQSCTVVWDDLFPPGQSPYPLLHRVFIFDVDTNALVYVENLPVNQNEWTFTYDVNVNTGGPRRKFRVSVAALTLDDRLGPLTSLAVSNPAPARVTLTATAISELIFAETSRTPDTDFGGTLFWASQTSGFNPLTTPVTQDVMDVYARIPAKTETVYYVRAAAYDTFGKNPADLNISDEVRVRVSITLFDPNGPPIPGTPTLTTETEVAADGTVTANVRATWAASSGENFSDQYEVAVSEGGGSFVHFSVTGPSFELRGFPPNRQVRIKVRALPKNGFAPSDWSQVATITTGLSNVPPDNPTNVSATGTYQGVTVQWTAPAARDVAYIEFWYADGTHTTPAPSGTASVRRISSGATVAWDDTVLTEGKRTYWLRAVNSSGLTAAGYTAPVTATNPAIRGANLAANIIDATKLAANLKTIEVLDQLPPNNDPANTDGRTVVVDGALYTYSADTGKFQTPAGSLDTLPGKIKRTQIEDGAISTPQLSVNEIFADSAVLNRITVGVLTAGAIKATMLDVGSVTASKLAFSSQNLFPNADFNQGLANVEAGISAANTGLVVSGNFDLAATPNNVRGVRLTGTGTATAAAYIYGYLLRPSATGTRQAYAVTPGDRFEFSTYLAGQNLTSAAVGIDWFKSDGTYLSTSYGTTVQPASSGGLLANHARSVLLVTVPATAAIARPFFQGNFASGAASPWVTAFMPMLARARLGQAEVSDYVDPAVTALDGQNIYTGSLHANRIIAGTITTDRFTSNTIDANILTTDTLKARVIATGVLTADNIVVGSGTLSSVFTGGNTTKISGGAIETNTIDANRIRVGSRGVQMVGVSFGSQRNPEGTLTNDFAWTAGTISLVGDPGNVQTYSIQAGSATIDGGYWYVYWNRNNSPNTFQLTKDVSVAYSNPENVQIATVSNVTGISTIVGGTVIDGTLIMTRSIQANSIAANQIQAIHIAANSITADKIAAGAISANSIGAGTITADNIFLGSDRFAFVGSQRRIRIYSPNLALEPITIGDLGGLDLGGANNGTLYGITVRGANNKIVMYAHQGGAYIDGVFIGDATITNAKIGNAAITNAKIANLEVDNIKIANGAISQVVAAGSDGQIATTSIYSRSGSSRFLIQGFRRGQSPTRQLPGINSGVLYIEYSFDGSNFNQLDAIHCTFSHQYDRGQNIDYMYLHSTYLSVVWPPGYTGTIWFRTRDTNSIGLGGTQIMVTELAK